MHRRPIFTSFTLLIGTFGCAHSQNGTSSIVSQQYFNNPGGAVYYQIATLPASTFGTLDHLHMVATFNGDWAASTNSTIDLTMGNRGGFSAYYTVTGQPVLGAHAHIVAYSMADSSVNVYLALADAFDTASYAVLDSIQETIYQPAVATFASTPAGVPAGQQPIFDTASPSYPPLSYTGISGGLLPTGKLAVGTSAPQAAIHVASPTVNLGSTFTQFGNGNVVIEGQGARSQGTGAALTFATAAALDGSNTWEQGRILSTADNGNDGDASGRLSLQTRYLNASNGWDWRNNLVLTSSGSVGVGTTSPSAALEVNGGIKIDGPGVTFADGSQLKSANGQSGSLSSLNVQGSGTGLIVSGTNLDPNMGYSLAPLENSGKLLLGWNMSGGNGEEDFIENRGGGGSGGFRFYDYSNTGALTPLMTMTGTGNVGIGTTSPSAALEVNGGIKIDGPGVTFADGSQLKSANGQSGSLSSLNVQGSGTGLIVSGTNLDPNMGYSLAPLENSGKLLLGWNMSGGNGEEDFIENRGGGGSGGFRFYDYSNTGVLTPLMTMTGTGSLGLGVTNPGTDLNQQQQTGPVLEVVGNIAFKQGAPGVGTGAGIIFSDGTSQTTAYQGTSCPIADVVMPDKTIVAQGGDYAEAVDVNGDRATYEPGDVMVISDSVSSDVTRSEEPYSTRVAGIYSTKPGYVGRRQTSNPKLAKSEIPMAMIGIVPTKVTADNGPVHRGDLLVTSSQRGYAMKGTDRLRMVGSVVGKAMGTLESGSGLIEVLVTLQ